jgi:GDPmannose 4,6-dehydratase
MQRRALITGITGQDGVYLAEFLLARGYEVHGMTRRSKAEVDERLHRWGESLHLHQADVSDQMAIVRILQAAQPQELYHLAAQSFVPASWKQPLLTGEFTALGVTRMLDAIRLVDPTIRFYQAGSSEMFGHVEEEPQNEQTSFRPRNPYGVAKLYAHWMTVNYRETYGLFASSGILYNHESPLRGKEFVTRKITDAVARIKLGEKNELRLENLDSQRDWGFAGDFVESMWLTLQQETASDYVIATGVLHSVRELVEMAFGHVGLDWNDYVTVDSHFIRSSESNRLRGDSTKARRELGWQPSTSFEELIGTMVEADLERVERELAETK